METLWNSEKQKYELYCTEFSGEKEIVCRWFGDSFEDCVRQFEIAVIFDGLTIYQAEQEIEVIFG